MIHIFFSKQKISKLVNNATYPSLNHDREGPKPSFSAVPLSALGLPEGARPLRLSAVPGTKNVAAVSFAGADRSEDVLSLVSEGGKLRSANALLKEGGKGTTSVSLLTGCKNTDDSLHVQQSCVDDRCWNYENSVRVTPMGANGKPGSSSSFRLPFPVSKLEGAWATCDDEGGFRAVLLTADGTLAAVDKGSKDGEALWTRDEALAAVDRVEMLAAARDDDDGAYDEDHLSEGGDVAMDVLVKLIS